jgi:uncharacterized protein (DUF58 family)
MTADAEALGTIPLHPRRRLVGSLFGAHRSIRRGHGSDVAGSRPYRPGDHFHSIDWKASARLSSVSGGDDFLVRERYSEETARVVLVCDRAPTMQLFPPDLPWLSKPRAVRSVVHLLARSALDQRSVVGYLDFARHGRAAPGAPFWRPPRSQAVGRNADLLDLLAGYLDRPFDAPADGVARSLAFLSAVRGALPAGSFVFVCSDFLVETPRAAWEAVANRGWDVVAVIVQDPVWEQSFPAIGGELVPLADAQSGRLLRVRLSRREAAESALANEERLRRLRAEVAAIGVDNVLVGADEPAAIRRAFLEWADARVAQRGRLR